MRNPLSTLIVFVFFLTNAKAQFKPDSIRTDPSINGQYQLLLSKSRTLDGYKMINPYRLSTFWKSVQDTLAISKRQLSSAKKEISGYKSEIRNLKQHISGTENSLASSNAKINKISLLGISFTKGNYNLIVWGLILTLTLTLIIVILRSAKNIHEARYRSTLYEEISQEYQAYKVKANEKEKKLARELQDERNKLEELRNR
ncbi:hypothetical protein [Pedobacter sp. JY14-1]|uniref:hypothetical protein n=1 Tax=Pedobacter sp. JY14-1 TaxID=3034151 RepID=UPI0023E0C5E8|nr:hypothetical protein [Pedobacter sp. JY14-1]